MKKVEDMIKKTLDKKLLSKLEFNPQNLLKKGNQFDTFTEAYINILNNIIKNGKESIRRGVKTKELNGYGWELNNPYENKLWIEERGANYSFIEKYFTAIINGVDHFGYLALDNPKAWNFSPDFKEFKTAYGPRVIEQLSDLLSELNRDLYSRRAIIHILNEKDYEILNGKIKAEYPCMESIQVMVREENGENYLDLYTVMRSQDAGFTISIDLYLSTEIQKYLVGLLNNTILKDKKVKVGKFYHYSKNIHLYWNEGLEKLFNGILKKSTYHLPLKYPTKKYLEKLKDIWED